MFRVYKRSERHPYHSLTASIYMQHTPTGKMRSFVFILLASVLTIGVNAGETEKLVGAEKAEIGEFPYQVSIRLGGEHFCGGALITKKHVLTAAHCVYPIKKRPELRNYLTIVTGTNRLSSGGKSYKTVALSYYQKYYDQSVDPDFIYDIGVITLASEVELSKFVKIVPLPTKEVKGGEDAVISGWGTMRSPRTPTSEALRKLDVKIVSAEECQEYYGLELKIHDSLQICAYKKRTTGTCSGDSGGPLVSGGEIIGVVSGGVACAKGFPDIYTRVHHYLDYIKGIIGDDE